MKKLCAIVGPLVLAGGTLLAVASGNAWLIALAGFITGTAVTRNLVLYLRRRRANP